MSSLGELRAIMRIDLADLYALMEGEDDWDKLVALWEDVQDFRRDIGELNADLEAKIYDRQDKERPYGSKVVTRYKSSSKKWDHDEVRRRIRKFCADPETGEVDEAKVAQIERKAGYVSYWRVQDLPFEVDEDTRSVVYGAKKIRVEAACPTSPTPTAGGTSSAQAPPTPSPEASSTSSSSEKPLDTSATTA